MFVVGELDFEVCFYIAINHWEFAPPSQGLPPIDAPALIAPFIRQ